MKSPTFVSVHGGHSGQFCIHAADSLEEIVQSYIAKNYTWVGITEHTPAISERLLAPDEREAGLSPEILLNRFDDYMRECRRLQHQYRGQITIFASMEIESYSGYEEFIPHLIDTFRPDYIVGSVHFINDIGFDYSRQEYDRAVEKAGGKDQLYCQYFDLQYEMIELLKPAVVGHFDLIRLFDKEYKRRLQKPDIMSRIQRNLQLIKDLDLIMDYNLRSLLKGADEPYISRVILEMARELEIAVVPGDDSHGLSSIGPNMAAAVNTLADMGFNTNWPQPKLLSHR
ncbi:MAG: histidinol-phosphatase [Desulforhopalus sp.]